MQAETEHYWGMSFRSRCPPKQHLVAWDDSDWETVADVAQCCFGPAVVEPWLTVCMWPPNDTFSPRWLHSSLNHTGSCAITCRVCVCVCVSVDGGLYWSAAWEIQGWVDMKQSMMTQLPGHLRIFCIFFLLVINMAFAQCVRPNTYSESVQ